MKAAVLEEKNKIVIKEVPTPKIDDNSILIKVKACGVCGSDIRIYRKGGKRVKYPTIIGHEITGVIEKVGKNIKDFKPGQRVASAPGHGCLDCIYCNKGHENVCINPYPSVGYAYDGGFAEYFLVPPHLVKAGFVNELPVHVSFDEASISEPLACCINAHRNLNIKKDSSVLIIGAGPVGCMHLVLSKLKGAKVYISDLDDKRLEYAKKFNPDKIINSKKLEETIMHLTSNIGVD